MRDAIIDKTEGWLACGPIAIASIVGAPLTTAEAVFRMVLAGDAALPQSLHCDGLSLVPRVPFSPLRGSWPNSRPLHYGKVSVDQNEYAPANQGDAAELAHAGTQREQLLDQHQERQSRDPKHIHEAAHEQ